MSKIFGTFVFNGATFDAEFRSGNNGSNWSQRGFAKCLIINRGTTAGGERTDGHTYFGDDKYEVLSAEENGDTIVLKLATSLSNPDDIWTRTDTITLKIKK